MSLSLKDIRRITAEIADQHHPNVEVVAATTSEEGAGYSELILRVRGVGGPHQLMIGVNRDTSEQHFRAVVESHLQRHLG